MAYGTELGRLKTQRKATFVAITHGTFLLSRLVAVPSVKELCHADFDGVLSKIALKLSMQLYLTFLVGNTTHVVPGGRFLVSS